MPKKYSCTALKKDQIFSHDDQKFAIIHSRR